MELKYVMFDGCLPVIFGEYFEHKNVRANGTQATSAGRLSINHETKTVTTYGQSIGMMLKPDPDDARILQKLFFDNF